MSRNELDCPEIQASLPLYVGEDLDGPLSGQVQSHLQHCGACSRSLEALRAALASFAVERERVDASVDLWPALERELLGAGMITTSASSRTGAAAPRLEVVAGATLAPKRVAERSARGTWLRRVTVLAAAAGLAFVAWRWASDASSHRSSPVGSTKGDVALGELRRGQSVPSSSGGDSILPVREVPARAGSTTRPDGAPVRRDLALVSDSTSPASAVDGEVAARSAGAGASALAAPGDGLRRVPDGEALLRDSIGTEGARRDYSLAGSRGLR